jgi:hypothetical protein
MSQAQNASRKVKISVDDKKYSCDEESQVLNNAVLNAQDNVQYDDQSDDVDQGLAGGAKKGKKVAAKKGKKVATKKGGSIMKDVSNLAVPFGILLAKQGLDKLVKKSESDKKKPAKKGGEVSEGQKAAVGGAKKAKAPAKKPQVAPKKGGALKLQQEFDKLSKEIESFLSKY